MVLFTPFGIGGGDAADRVDPLVWTLPDLFPRMVKPQADADREMRGAAVEADCFKYRHRAVPKHEEMRSVYHHSPRIIQQTSFLLKQSFSMNLVSFPGFGSWRSDFHTRPSLN